MSVVTLEQMQKTGPSEKAFFIALRKTSPTEKISGLHQETLGF